jgi:hypothetical protein
MFKRAISLLAHRWLENFATRFAAKPVGSSQVGAKC